MTLLCLFLMAQVPTPVRVQGLDGGPALNVRLVLKQAPGAASTAVTCGVSPLPLPASAMAKRTSLCVVNNGATTIYVGPAGVTSSTGLPLSTGMSFCDDVGAQPLYCITASGTSDVRVLEN